MANRTILTQEVHSVLDRGTVLLRGSYSTYFLIQKKGTDAFWDFPFQFKVLPFPQFRDVFTRFCLLWQPEALGYCCMWMTGSYAFQSKSRLFMRAFFLAHPSLVHWPTTLPTIYYIPFRFFQHCTESCNSATYLWLQDGWQGLGSHCCFPKWPEYPGNFLPGQISCPKWTVWFGTPSQVTYACGSCSMNGVHFLIGSQNTNLSLGIDTQQKMTIYIKRVCGSHLRRIIGICMATFDNLTERDLYLPEFPKSPVWDLLLVLASVTQPLAYEVL